MITEPVKIMIRRFRDRLLESGLLIIAIALGIGASAAGFSLLVNTNEYGQKMLASPAYREIIVSTRDEASDMESPAELKPTEENTVLTGSDLEAAEIIPTVSYAYVANDDKLHFLNQGMMDRRMPGMNEQPAGNTQESESIDGSEKQAEGSASDENEEKAPADDFQKRMEEMKIAMEEAESDSSIITPEDIDELRGQQVTPDFFDAREITAEIGSLFTESDLMSTESLVVLGYNTAELLLEEGEQLSDLAGKKILGMEGYSTIIGVLKKTGEPYDDKYFSPYKNTAAQAGAGNFRNRAMDTQLIFSVSNPEDLDNTASLLSEWFTSRFGEGQVVLSNPREEASQLIQRNKGISYLILFLAVAGLFIASVNVSNILMGRALRMKKHVGILKALGASRKKILHLFAGEALAVTIGGALLGTALAFPLTKMMQDALDMTSSTTLPILTGVAISWILTICLTILPALQNSHIEAAEAMRAA